MRSELERSKENAGGKRIVLSRRQGGRRARIYLLFDVTEDMEVAGRSGSRSSGSGSSIRWTRFNVEEESQVGKREECYGVVKGLL